MTSKTLDENQDFSAELIESANKSSLGQWMLENSKVFFTIVGVIVVVALGRVWYNQWSESKEVESFSQVYDFREGSLKSFEDKKIKEDKLLSDYNLLSTTISFKQALLPISLELSNKLTDKKQAITLLENVVKLLGAKHTGSSLVNVQLASFYEDSENSEKSIEILENLKRNLPDFLASYTYFNLGRLYKNTGNKSKAKSEFTYLIEKYADSEESKLAKIMLTEL